MLENIFTEKEIILKYLSLVNKIKLEIEENTYRSNFPNDPGPWQMDYVIKSH